MVIYFFCAKARDKHIDGSMQRDKKIETNMEYSEFIKKLKVEIKNQAKVSIEEINITALNLI